MAAEFWSWDRYDSEARRLYDEGDYDAARELLVEGLALYPNSAELRVSLGYAHLAREEYAWARSAFSGALAIEPDHEEGLVGMGEVLLKFGERARAFLSFRRILDMGFGDDPDLMLSIGRALYREELYDRAETFFRRALQADSDCADAAAELAFTLYRRGDEAGALRLGRRALAADPGHHEARAFYANLLYDRGEFAPALAQFRRIPPEEIWDSVAAWRTVELIRRLEELSPAAAELRPYVERLEALTKDPSPEEELLREMAALLAPGEPGAQIDRDQLDLFGWLPWRDGPELHRVRASDGTLHEGDWLGIVRSMRDTSADPSLSVAQYMRREARRLHDLTGVRVPDDDPRGFIQESARLGLLRIER